MKRNSIFELTRIIALLGLMVYHLNFYINNLIPPVYAEYLADFSIFVFALLTGYYFFDSPKLKFQKVDNIEISENVVFRKATSRILWSIIYLNIVYMILYFSYLHSFVNYEFWHDNWYVWSLLIISFIGVFAQKIYFKLKNNLVFFVLIFCGVTLFIIGKFMLDFEVFLFRLWRLGMMIAALGFAPLIKISSNKTMNDCIPIGCCNCINIY